MEQIWLPYPFISTSEEATINERPRWKPRVHTDSPLACPRCSSVFTYKHNLNYHVKHLCGQEPRFQCPYCQYKTNWRKDVRKHTLSKHRGQRVDVLKLRWGCFAGFLSRGGTIIIAKVFVLSAAPVFISVSWWGLSNDVKILTNCLLSPNVSVRLQNKSNLWWMINLRSLVIKALLEN